ncbi:10007_t:CDS:2, partial [Ambispora gerdemannii]
MACPDCGKIKQRGVSIVEENQELRQQLAAVQKQLAEVLAELKKLKNNSTGKDSEKLNQQIVQNERLIASGSAVSEVEVRDQINKSEALMKEFNTTVSPVNDNKKDNDFSTGLVIGGGILALMGLMAILIIKK